MNDKKDVRVAAIDCGTNSIRLLIADKDLTSNQLKPVFRDSAIVRLGQGVDETGVLSEEALKRTQIALESFAESMNRFRVNKIRMVATSATRDAKNREDFFSMADSILSGVVSGSHAEIISGTEEAALSFAGATMSFNAEPRGEKFMVIDSGGGSTEFIFGSKDKIDFSYSVDVGCVRIFERFINTDPADKTEISLASDYVKKQILANIPLKYFVDTDKFVGVAGTFTTLVAMSLGLDTYSRADIHLKEVKLNSLYTTCDKVLASTLAERESLAVISPGRKDIIVGGAMIIKQIVEIIAAESNAESLVVSEQDILEGIALTIM